MSNSHHAHAGTPGQLDGPTLRSIREALNLPLRRIARHAQMSHGHLSKVERGEHGRPITPAVIAAYEKACGMSLHEAVATMARSGRAVVNNRGKQIYLGQMSDLRRRGYQASLGALLVGGQLGETATRVLDAAGRPTTPEQPLPADLTQLAALEHTLTSLDLRHGGALTHQIGRTLLRWAAPMLHPTHSTETHHTQLHATLGALTARAAWAAFDQAAHETARHLWRLALYCAVRARDLNLRAHLIADAAAQHHHLGHPDDAIELIQLIDGDDRVAPIVAMTAHGVTARAHATLGHSDACRRRIDAAETAYHHADPHTEGWLGRSHHPAHLAATTGHALAQLAQHTHHPTHLAEATQRLTTAIDQFDPHTHTRARVLAATRLATVHLTAGDHPQATTCTKQALTDATATDLHSARVHQALAELHHLATSDTSGTPALRELVDLLDTHHHEPGGHDHAGGGDTHDH